ncbi:MAG: hypothetical protein ACREXY_09920 [Gammaproteobacteria bacterium]
MDATTDQASLTRWIRNLTVAVWVAAIALMLNVAVTLSSYFGLSPMFRTSPETGLTDSLAGFHEFPIEQQIRSASAIVLTKYRRDGDRLTSVVAEILKHKPGTTFHYKVGDEYKAVGDRVIRANTHYGDGEVVFFAGSPATVRLSASYTNERIGMAGDVLLDTLRKIIAQER